MRSVEDFGNVGIVWLWEGEKPKHSVARVQIVDTYMDSEVLVIVIKELVDSFEGLIPDKEV